MSSYIVKDSKRNRYKTDGGWTVIRNGQLLGLGDVLRFTSGEAKLNPLPSNQHYVFFPARRWETLK